MTVSSTANRAPSTGDGVTTAFPFSFRFLATTEIRVFLGTVEQFSGFAVSSPGASGTVTFSTAPANGVSVVITRATALTQNTDYVANDAFSADSTEFALDRLTVGIQDVKAGVGRSLRVADHLPAINPIADPDDVVIAWADGIVSVKAYGAKGDGTTDDTAAIQLALNSGFPIYFPAGRYVITDKLTFSSTEGQMLVGAGRRSTFIEMSYVTFNMSATAAFQLTEAFQGFSDLSIRCVQPTTAVRANLKAYPWLIDLNSRPRADIRTVDLINGYNGIFGGLTDRGAGPGNCGGARISDVGNGCYNVGLRIDGALDSIYLKNYHGYPFDGSADATLLGVFDDGNTVAMDIGRLDDLVWSGGMVIHQQINFRAGVTVAGSVFGTVSSVAIESNSVVNLSAGVLTFASAYASIDGTLGGSFNVTGSARLTMSALEITNSAASATALIVLNGATAAVILNGINARMSGTGQKLVHVVAGDLTCIGGRVTGIQNVTRTVPVFDVDGGRATIQGVAFEDAGSGTGAAVDIANDNNHIVVGNFFGGWSFTRVSSHGFGQMAPNVSPASFLSGPLFVGRQRNYAFTSTLDGSGNRTIAHGIGSLNGYLPLVLWYYDVAGQWQMGETTKLLFDGTHAVITGGTPGATVYVNIFTSG